MSEQQWKQELRGAAVDMERELERAITYINDRIVPAVRRETQGVLRSLAVEMRRAADHLEGKPIGAAPTGEQGRSRP